MSSQAGTDLLGPLFGDSDVAEQLSDRARLQAMLEPDSAEPVERPAAFDEAFTGELVP